MLFVALAARAAEEAPSGDSQLRWLDPSAPDYRTPRAGEGFRTNLFGRDVEVETRDRRSTSAWDVGASAWYRWPEDQRFLPFGSIYLFRRPDENQFFRGTVVLVYNDLVYAHSLARESPFEAVLGFKSETVPTDSADYVDGERIKQQEVMKGDVLGSVGLGFRRQVEPGFGPLRFREGVDPQKPDNQLSLSATVEPGFSYFREGKDDTSDFAVPQDTFGLQGHLQLRLDTFERNLLDLLHEGYGIGIDATQGWRPSWDDWGIDQREKAGDGRFPRLLQGYGVAAGGIPGLGERHRVVGSVYAGVGGNLDRFSAPSIGGGPTGDEFLALSRPIVPGAAMGEFYPDHYAIGIAEYRYELFFFTYLSARGSVAWLDRDRFQQGQTVHREDDALTSVGGRITTGFVFKTRLQLDYNYNFDVIRDETHRGASEWVLHISRQF